MAQEYIKFLDWFGQVVQLSQPRKRTAWINDGYPKQKIVRNFRDRKLIGQFAAFLPRK